ncbi:MAG TPA: adenylyltransferase/cytidyltransferase family protein [Dongiaceae bacterium]|nr:adenylyltransferase/cytidyltransferase family protein [Dongiaceae bacterium]
MKPPARVVVSGGFDDIRSRDIRFLEEACNLGDLTVLLWPDAILQEVTGKPPKFSFSERSYMVGALRYVGQVVEAGTPDSLPIGAGVDVWADYAPTTSPTRARFARENNIRYHAFSDNDLRGFPDRVVAPSASDRKKVIVSGCFDWLHSGHVRFFEEVSRYGDLYVVVGHDANIRLLKGEGHPLQSQQERRYAVGAVRYVKEALISTGEGWLDADPEIRQLKPDIYAVNEDGDVGGKRDYCAALGIQYLVLKRTPAPGLPARTSTSLRGF